MTERGVVTAVKGRRATVEFDRKSACDSCHMCAVTRDGMKVKIVIENTLEAERGDIVTVSMGERFVLTAALVVYIIPLVLVGVGIGVGSLFGETLQIVLAVVGLALGLGIAMVLDRCVIRKRKGFVPEMTEIVRVSPVVTGGGAAAAAEVITDNAETEQPPEPGEDHPDEGGGARPE